MFPAELSFKRDSRLTPSARRVYDYLTTVLDFVEVRPVKVHLHAARAGIHHESFGGALDALAESGYLTLHGRGSGNVRQLTLAWSVNESKRAS